jgi:predicted AAA+ superfamily ATPase
MLWTLEESKTVNFCYHVTDPQVGLPITEDKSLFKLYVGDTGLMVTLAFWDKSFVENELYSKLLADKLPANLGYIYENLVAQMFRAAGNKLYYHTWPKDDKHNYEIDFLLSRSNKLCPIEVKSSGYKTHVSLDEFCKKFSKEVLWRYLVYTKDFRKDEETLMVPVYMVPFL